MVVEKDSQLSDTLNSQPDVLSIIGNGAGRGVLKKAISAVGDPVDQLIAVTDQDGVNALACHTATNLGIRQTVARISDSGLRSGLHNMGVKVFIDPDEATADELVRPVRLSGMSEHWEFTGGRLLAVGAIAQPNSPLPGRPLRQVAAAYTTTTTDLEELTAMEQDSKALTGLFSWAFTGGRGSLRGEHPVYVFYCAVKVSTPQKT